MTVDEKNFFQYAPAPPDRVAEHISQVREVTGIAEDDQIRKALDKTRDVGGDYNLARAVDLLLGSQSPTVGMAPLPPAVVLSPPAAPVGPQELKHKVVDLTEETKPEDDLQRAIALSLQDGGNTTANAATSSQTVSGVSQEEQDVSKALEASLLETTRGRKKKEEQNPHDRERDGEWPVGLKNVGQTCWFSAVIQSLFHLPVFRALVLNFSPPEQQQGSEKERKNLEFMAELRKLFALLLSSRRKYVDPSRAVGILRGSLGGENTTAYDNNQQDVCEFTHKLLDWLEEAFKIRDVSQKSDVPMKEDPANKDNAKAEEEPMEAENLEKADAEKESPGSAVGMEEGHRNVGEKNPMYSLFYGQVRIEGRNKGAEFSRTEQFGQWPLQVNGNRDLHESLEASTAHENFDSSGGAEERDGQERWFTSLPPVLFLELSRFQFDRSRGVAEKVNNALEFPDVIYLDRYLEVNKAVTRGKREQVRRLVERRTALQKELAGYTSYGGPNAASSGDKFPLVSVLQLALDFAKSGGEVPNEAWEGEQAMQVDSPCPSPRGILTPASSVANLADGSGGGSILPDGSISIPIMREGGNLQQVATTEMEVEQSGEGAGQLAVARCQGPIPRHVSELELKVLSSCLARWSKEVEEEIATLNANLQDIETRIKGMYEEEGLKKRGYRLHAVMVHEGDAQQGHYWAYVHLSGEKRGWLKFNDNTVSQTTWGELSKEAVGGRLSTSAYSCVYVDLARPELVTPEEDGTVTEVQALPPDLDTFILEDNKSFAAEILKWDEEQLLGKKEESDEAAVGEEASGPAVLIGDDPECQIIMQKSHDFAHGHALLAKEATLETLNAVSNSAMDKQRKEKGGTSAVINKIFQKVKQCIQSPKSEGLDERQDPRLESFLHYLIANEQQGVDLYRRALLEQVSLPEFEQHGELGREVVRTAKEMKQKDGRDEIGEEIGLWHRAYHQFRIAVNYFVLGVEKYTENQHEEALELLTVSYIVNDRIGEDPPNMPTPANKMMKLRGLMKHFHLAVESLNTLLVNQFETGDDPGGVGDRVARLIVPAIQILQARTHKQPGGRDATILEEVRSRWCAMIDSPMAERKRDYWGTIFNVVMGDDNSAALKPPSNLRYPRLADDLKLPVRYRSAMQRLMRESDK